MSADSAKCFVNLKEQETSHVLLLPEEADFLREQLKFDVFSDGKTSDGELTAADKRALFAINPRQYVGHFILSTGTTLNIRPKIPAANVFRMLAYVYASWNRELFDKADVLYEKDDFLFEPLVQLFNELVARRVRRGLVQDYIRHEDNLRVLKGAVSFDSHIRENVPGHPDRLFCKYYENTCDIQDNQIIKWTLRSLLPVSSAWSDRAARMLRANFHQFEAVSMNMPERGVFERRHYHRLNDDYRVIHSLCKLFLENSSISEKAGAISFSGFHLDMNQLFERFVTEAFLRIAKGSSYSVLQQNGSPLSDDVSDFGITIVPDVTIFQHGEVVSIVDAKYKKTDGGFANHDFYQLLAYGTGLSCPSTFLFFPTSEYSADGQIRVRHSPVTIDVRRVDIEDSQCVDLVERAARDVLYAGGAEFLAAPRHVS